MSVILDHSGPNTDQDLGKVCILWMNRSTGEIEVEVENRSTNQTVVSRKDTNTEKRRERHKKCGMMAQMRESRNYGGNV